jgi:hypothetical protein
MPKETISNNQFFNVSKSSYGTIDLLNYRVVTICFQHYIYFTISILSLMTQTASQHSNHKPKIDGNLRWGLGDGNGAEFITLIRTD